MPGKVMGELWRAVSVEVVRGQALCLLDRLATSGQGLGRLTRGGRDPRGMRRQGGGRGKTSTLPTRGKGSAESAEPSSPRDSVIK